MLATLAPTLRKAVETAVRKAFVILDGTLLRATRTGCRPKRPGRTCDAEDQPARGGAQGRPRPTRSPR